MNKYLSPLFLNLLQKLKDLYQNKLFWPSFGFLCVLIFAYSPQFTADFIGDDIGRIKEQWNTFTLGNIYDHAIGDRPALLVSIWFDINVLKLTPGLMRLENLFLLSLILILMFKIAKSISEITDIKIHPLFTAMILFTFALHPLNTQTIGHVIQRGILLSSLFSLISTHLLLKIKFHIRSTDYLWAILFWILALLSKPNIAFIPIAWFILFRHIGIKVKLREILPFVLLLAIPVFLYKIGQYNQQATSSPVTSLIYFFTQAKIILLYLKLLIFPVGQKFNHDIIPNLPIAILPALTLWFTYLGALLIFYKFLKHRIAAVFFICSFLALMPESSFFPILHYSFEHRLFTPMIFLFLAFPFIKHFNKQKLALALIPICICYSILTFKRNKEVQKLADWATTELKHTCNVVYMQNWFTTQLIFLGEYEKLGAALNELKKCPNQSMALYVNTLMYEIAVEDGLPEELLNKLKYFLHSESQINLEARTLMLNGLRDILIKKGMMKDSMCLYEDLLSIQLKFLKSALPSSLQLIKDYINVANLCLAEFDNSDSSRDQFQKFKIRVIMHHYFGKKDLFLKSDLDKAPINEKYDYLRKLYNEKME